MIRYLISNNIGGNGDKFMKKIKISNWSDTSLIEYLNNQLTKGFKPVCFNNNYLYLEECSAREGRFFIDYAPIPRINKLKPSPYLNFFIEQGIKPIAFFQTRYLFYTSIQEGDLPVFPENQKWKDFAKHHRFSLLFEILLLILFLYEMIVIYQTRNFLFHWFSCGLLLTLGIYIIFFFIKGIFSYKLYLIAKQYQNKNQSFNDFANQYLIKHFKLNIILPAIYLIIMLPSILIEVYYNGLSFPTRLYLIISVCLVFILYPIITGNIKLLRQNRNIFLLLLSILFISLFPYHSKNLFQLTLSDELPIITYNNLYQNNPPSSSIKESITQMKIPFAKSVICYYGQSKISNYIFYSYHLPKSNFLIQSYYDYYQTDVEQATKLVEYYPTYHNLNNVYIYENSSVRLILLATYDSTFIYAELTVPYNMTPLLFLETINSQISR